MFLKSWSSKGMHKISKIIHNGLWGFRKHEYFFQVVVEEPGAVSLYLRASMLLGSFCDSSFSCSWLHQVPILWVSIAFWLTLYVLYELCGCLYDLFMSWELDESEDCILIITPTTSLLSPQLGAWLWLSICSKCSVNMKRVGLLYLLYKVGKLGALLKGQGLEKILEHLEFESTLAFSF